MAGLFARGGEWKQCLPEWTEEELKAMEANGGVLPVEMRAPAEGEDSGAVDVGEAGDPAVSPEAAAQLSRAARAVVAEPAMTSEERMDYLRARGVIIETHEERTEKAAAAAGGAKAAPVALRKEDQFCYMKIPHDIKEPVARLHGNLSGRGDALMDLLKPVFADSGVLDARTVERETTERLGKLMSGQPIKAPSLATMQKLGNEGGTEAYPLARGTASNGYRTVSLYIDEIGTLRQRPRNARAEQVAANAGLTGLSIHGDAYVGRVQSGPGGVTNVDFYDSELEEGAQWAKEARKAHMEELASINNKGPASGYGTGYTWSQTDDEVEAVVDIPVDANETRPLKSRVKVSYGKGECLDVKADGKPVLLVTPLFAPVDTSGCSWTVDGKDKIVVTMEKRDPREWHTFFLPQNLG